MTAIIASYDKVKIYESSGFPLPYVGFYFPPAEGEFSYPHFNGDLTINGSLQINGSLRINGSLILNGREIT